MINKMAAKKLNARNIIGGIGNDAGTGSITMSQILPDGLTEKDILVWDATLNTWKVGQETIELPTATVGQRIEKDNTVWKAISNLNVETITATKRIGDTDAVNHIFSCSVSRIVELSPTCYTGKIFHIIAKGTAPLLIYNGPTYISAIGVGNHKTFLKTATDWQIVSYQNEIYGGESEVAFFDADGLITSTDKIRITENKNLLIDDAGTSGAIANIAIGNSTDAISMKTSKNATSRVHIKGYETSLLVEGGFSIANYKPIEAKVLGSDIFNVDKSGLTYCKGLTVDIASKANDKVLVSDANGLGTWLSKLADETQKGFVEIATQVEFDAETEKHGDIYLSATIPQIKRAIPPMKYIALGTDILLDTNDVNSAVFTLPIPTASYKYEIEFLVYLEFSATTTRMNLFIERSNDTYLSGIFGTYDFLEYKGTNTPLRQLLFQNDGSNWAGQVLSDNGCIICAKQEASTRFLLKIKAFIEPTNALNLVLKASKHDGTQCKVKARSYATAKGFN